MARADGVRTMVRIFNVEFEYQGIFDSKTSTNLLKDNLNVSAKDGESAIKKAKSSLFKPHTFIDDDEETLRKHGSSTPVKVKVDYKNIQVIGVTLLAEA